MFRFIKTAALAVLSAGNPVKRETEKAYSVKEVIPDNFDQEIHTMAMQSFPASGIILPSLQSVPLIGDGLEALLPIDKGGKVFPMAKEVADKLLSKIDVRYFKGKGLGAEMNSYNNVITHFMHNFFKVYYESEYNRKRLDYLLSRDGFSIELFSLQKDFQDITGLDPDTHAVVSPEKKTYRDGNYRDLTAIFNLEAIYNPNQGYAMSSIIKHELVSHCIDIALSISKGRREVLSKPFDSEQEEEILNELLKECRGNLHTKVTYADLVGGKQRFRSCGIKEDECTSIVPSPEYYVWKSGDQESLVERNAHLIGDVRTPQIDTTCPQVSDYHDRRFTQLVKDRETTNTQQKAVEL